MKSIILTSLALLVSLSAYAADNTRTILLKNGTPYLFTLEDKSTNEKWSVEGNNYTKIVLRTHLPTTASPLVEDEDIEENEQDTAGEIPFPHTLDINYRYNGQTTYITSCVTSFPEKDSIIQVFVGNSGIHCVVSDYQPN